MAERRRQQNFISSESVKFHTFTVQQVRDTDAVHWTTKEPAAFSSEGFMTTQAGIVTRASLQGSKNLNINIENNLFPSVA